MGWPPSLLFYIFLKIQVIGKFSICLIYLRRIKFFDYVCISIFNIWYMRYGWIIFLIKELSLYKMIWNTFHTIVNISNSIIFNFIFLAKKIKEKIPDFFSQKKKFKTHLKRFQTLKAYFKPSFKLQIFFKEFYILLSSFQINKLFKVSKF